MTDKTSSSTDQGDPFPATPPIRLRYRIPVTCLVGSICATVGAILISPDDEKTGFVRNGEIAKALLALAAALISVGVVSYFVSDHNRANEQRHKQEEANREREEERNRIGAENERRRMEADAIERRRLVGELRDIHHSITTCKLKIRAHKSVKTYGVEIRESVIPTISQLGAVIGDVNHRSATLIPDSQVENIIAKLRATKTYLTELANEYEVKYFDAARVQEKYEERRKRLDNRDAPAISRHLRRPTKSRRRESSEASGMANGNCMGNSSPDVSDPWTYLVGRVGSDLCRFPRLAILLELRPAINSDKCLHGGRYTHQSQFSEPIRFAMDAIDHSGPDAVAN